MPAPELSISIDLGFFLFLTSKRRSGVAAGASAVVQTIVLLDNPFLRDLIFTS
jgi:hypothetical protein